MTIRHLSALVVIAAISSFLLVLQDSCWAASYELAISQMADDAVDGVVITCAENTACRVRFPVQLGGDTVELTAVAIIFPRNAYVRFEAGGEPVPTGSNGYIHVALGRDKVASIGVSLQPAAAWTYEEAPGSVFHWPVQRGSSAALANVRLTIVRLD